MKPRIESENEKRDLRDKFAMAALTGLLAWGDNIASYTHESIPNLAYEMADAMMTRRES